jgi:hypothetical protein
VRHRRRHNRNPFGVTGNTKELVQLVIGAGGGILASVNVPGWLLAMFGMADAGILSYAAAIAATLVPAWLLKSMPDIAKGWVAGGGGAIVWRAYDDLTSSNLLTITGRSGVQSFFTKPVRVPLPAGSVFSPYSRGARMGGPALLPAATPSATSIPVAKTGMHWVQM